MIKYSLPENPAEAFRAIYRLEDSTQRTILLNHHFNGMSYKEIAGDLQLTENTVYRLKRMALQQLGGELSGKITTEEGRSR